MDNKRKTPRNRIAIITIGVIIAGLGCLCLPGNVTPTSSPESLASSPTPPRPLSTPPQPSPTQPPPYPTPTQGLVVNTAMLNAIGPWLLMETSEGLWAANPDGSGLTQLTDFDYWYGSLEAAVQPQGSLVVFITSDNYDFHNLALNLLSLPDGQVTKITDLTSSETEGYSNSAPGDPGFEALRAVGEQLNYAWSSDGTRLAFTGVMDGPTADIYIYTLATGEIQRVSQDEAQDFSPSWSPDGNHLLYLGANGFGTGAGMVMAGVWSADGDGRNAALLFPSDAGGEEIVGWLDNTTAVLATWDQPCGIQQLRLYDLVSKQETMLNAGCLLSAAVSDSSPNEVLFANDRGLYLLTAENRTPVLVSEDQVAWIGTVGNLGPDFIVGFENGGIATFFDYSPIGGSLGNHQVSPVDAPSRSMDVAEYGAIWGWTSADDNQPGAWVSGPGIEIGRIFTGKASLPIWDPHNNLLFFAPESGGGYTIYRATFDNYYQDLSTVAYLNAAVFYVTWLGDTNPYD